MRFIVRITDESHTKATFFGTFFQLFPKTIDHLQIYYLKEPTIINL